VIRAGYQNVQNSVLWGTVLGAAAWSAYAATEVVFASLLFGFTRPYAAFTSWHWTLDRALAHRLLMTGALIGAVAGFAVYLLRNTGLFQDNSPVVMQSAASLTLIGRIYLEHYGQYAFFTGGTAVLVVSMCFAILLLAEMQSAKWPERLGMLTNPWVISGVLLGVEQTADLFDMVSAQELSGSGRGDALVGSHPGCAGGGLGVDWAAGPAQTGTKPLGLATLALALALIGAVEVMGISHATAAQGGGFRPRIPRASRMCW